MAEDTKKPSPVGAVQAVFEALEPLDSESRERVLASVRSLLGMQQPGSGSGDRGSHQSQVESEVRRSDRATSPVEVIQEKQPATNTQKIAVFAYYRERHEGVTRFSRSDLKEYFAKAKEAPPGNYDRDFNNAVKEGWIHEDGEESYLTSRGLEAVEAGFEGKGRPRGRAVKARKPAARKRTPPERKAPKS